jgi:hypothetical protein
MQPCRFIIQSYGKTEQVDIDAERILIGSGAHCDIRLGQEQAAWEHLTIDEENGQMVARVIPNDALASVDGFAFRELVLHDGAVIKLENALLTYQVRQQANDGAGKVRRSRKKETSPLAYLGLVMIPLLGLYVLLHDPEPPSLAPPSRVPDPLASTITSCPIREHGAQVAFAEEKESLAQTKRQRWRFYTRDGVESVQYFELAEACYKAAGDPRAAEVGMFAKGMRAGVQQEFHVYRIRLERALDRGDATVALAQIRFIEGILTKVNPDDEYVRWLLIVKQKLQAGKSEKKDGKEGTEKKAS